MKRFTASLTTKGTPRIISVHTDNIELAKSEIERQLNKPGRTEILKQWKRNGSHIIETTDEFAQ